MMFVVAALALASVLIVVLFALDIVSERKAFNLRCSAYVDHAVRHYPVGRCHCSGCTAFRAYMGWPP
jgi:hypothetical protein